MMGILNLAHGTIYMIGGYVTYAFAVWIGLHSWTALLASTAVFGLFGVFLERYCFRPFVGNFDASVIVCVGITVILQNIVNNMLGTQVMAVPHFVRGIFKAGLVSVSYERILTLRDRRRADGARHLVRAGDGAGPTDAGHCAKPRSGISTGH